MSIVARVLTEYLFVHDIETDVRDEEKTEMAFYFALTNLENNIL